MRIKYLVMGAGVAVIVPVAVVAWWLLSPLFIDKMVEEELPFSAGAAVPEGMTRAEVEQIMAGMARVDHEVDEAMPASMMGGQTTGGAPATALKQGSFRDADRFHQGSGQATIYRGPDGSHLLRLEDFRVTNGPDLHVILSPNPDPQTRDEVSAPGYIDLGSLKGNVGDQNYQVPEAVNIEALGSVVIYCKPFHVIFSVASLHNPG